MGGRSPRSAVVTSIHPDRRITSGGTSIAKLKSLGNCNRNGSQISALDEAAVRSDPRRPERRRFVAGRPEDAQPSPCRLAHREARPPGKVRLGTGTAPARRSARRSFARLHRQRNVDAARRALDRPAFQLRDQGDLAAHQTVSAAAVAPAAARTAASGCCGLVEDILGAAHQHRGRLELRSG